MSRIGSARRIALRGSAFGRGLEESGHLGGPGTWRFEYRRAEGKCRVQGFARLNVMRTYPEPLFASNAAGRPLSGFGALSQVVKVSSSRT